jgi:hypothetical protein
MKGIEKTLGMHLKVLEEKKKHRLAVIQEQKLLLPLPLPSMRGTRSMRTFLIAVRLSCYALHTFLNQFKRFYCNQSYGLLLLCLHVISTTSLMLLLLPKLPQMLPM